MRNSVIFGTATALGLLGINLWILHLGFIQNTEVHWFWYLLGAITVMAGVGWSMFSMKKQNHGIFPFKMAFLTGLNTSMAAAFLFPALLWLSLSDFYPELIEHMVRYYEIPLEDANKIILPTMFGKFIETTAIGILFTVIASYFMSRK